MKRLTAATRAEVEQRRAEKLAELEQVSPTPSQFSRDTTVAELIDWWLNSIARHQVKASTYDSYRRFGGYFKTQLGSRAVVDVRAETLIAWQANQLDRHAPLTVLNSRKVARQAFSEAVKLDLIPANPFDLVRAPRAQRVNAGRALAPDDAKKLILAAQQFRLGATVTLLFCQGWRVSEVLGLAWEDLDLEASTAHIQRGATYSPSTGTVLGQTKTSGAQGVHFLAPASVVHLREHKARNEAERETFGLAWPTHSFEGQRLSMVFTTSDGSLVNRQSVVHTIERAARAAGLDPTGLATHTGRRTVITALYANGGLDLADIARHVGHVDTATTAEYVRSLGTRPQDTARRAAELLDPTLSTDQPDEP
ncbi:MAG: site-specific integrase [Acidimicrobiales bacterium]